MNTRRRIFQVHCPSCLTEFPIDSAKVPEAGVAAICSICLRVFPIHQPPEEVESESTAEGDAEPEDAAILVAGEVALTDDFESSAEADMGLPIGSQADWAVEENIHINPDVGYESAFEGGEVPTLEAGPEVGGFEDVVLESVADGEDGGGSDIGSAVAETEASPEAPSAPEFESKPEEPWVSEFDAQHETHAIEVEPETSASKAEHEATVAPDAPEYEAEPEAPAAPVFDPPRAPKPEFEDLSSFTNEILAEVESTSESPVVERTRPTPEKVERFGRRDPHERARHLARVLVSDIIAYYPVRYQESLARRSLQADFADEIQKSYREYVDQVGSEMAESTPYFVDALNHVLGRGEKFF